MTDRELPYSYQILSVLMRLHRYLFRNVGPVLQEMGMCYGDMFVLKKLRHHGSSPASKLARESLVSASTTTGTLDRLESLGLIERTPNPEDRRGVIVRPTAKFDEMMGELHRRLQISLSGTLGAIPEADAEKILHSLEQLEDLLRGSDARGDRDKCGK